MSSADVLVLRAGLINLSRGNVKNLFRRLLTCSYRWRRNSARSHVKSATKKHPEITQGACVLTSKISLYTPGGFFSSCRFFSSGVCGFAGGFGGGAGLAAAGGGVLAGGGGVGF